jgi:hypothetical protein
MLLGLILGIILVLLVMLVKRNPAPMPAIAATSQPGLGQAMAMVRKLMEAGVSEGEIQAFHELCCRMERGEISALQLAQATYERHRRIYDVIEATPESQVMRS